MHVDDCLLLNYIFTNNALEIWSKLTLIFKKIFLAVIQFTYNEIKCKYFLRQVISTVNIFKKM